MRKDKISAVIGVLLVFVIAAAFLAFCKSTASNAPLREGSDYDDYDDDYDDYEDEPDFVAALGQRGYVADRPLPEQIQKLIDTNLFGVTEEKIKLAEEELFDGYESEEDYAEDYFDEDEEYDPEELAELIEEDKEYSKEELEEEYEDTLKYIKKFDAPEYLNKNHNLFVTSTAGDEEEETEDLYCALKWDNKTGECLDKEKIAAIENCGFPGFSNLISEVESREKARRNSFEETSEYFGGDEDEDAYYEYGGGYTLFCRGIEFYISPSDGAEYRYLSVQLNRSSCFIPQRYKNVIDGVMADGSYYLYSSYAAGGKDVLVFHRDQTVSYNEYMESPDTKNEWVDKRIVFIFENGNLVDYYVVSQIPRLVLDDVDKKVLDTYVSGLGKTLSGVPEGTGRITGYLFRAED